MLEWSCGPEALQRQFQQHLPFIICLGIILKNSAQLQILALKKQIYY